MAGDIREPHPDGDVCITLPSGGRLWLCHDTKKHEHTGDAYVRWDALDEVLDAAQLIFGVLGGQADSPANSDKTSQALAEARGCRYDKDGRCTNCVSGSRKNGAAANVAPGSRRPR